MTVADSAANLAVYRKQRGGPTGGGSYPTLRLLALVACGTRTVIDAVFGPTSAGETAYAADLTRSLRAGMLLLADRNFGCRAPGPEIAAAEADFLVRVRTGYGAPGLPVLQPPARRVVAVALRRRPRPRHRRRLDRHHQRRDRLHQLTAWSPPCPTTARYPAADLAALYHERWEIEVGHRWYRSSCAAFSWLCSLFVVGFVLLGGAQRARA